MLLMVYAAVIVVCFITFRSWRAGGGGAAGRHARIAGEYLIKGSSIDVEGRLRTRKWTDKDGTERYATEIVAQELVKLGGKRKDGGPEGRVPVGETSEMEEDVPFRGPRPATALRDRIGVQRFGRDATEREAVKGRVVAGSAGRVRAYPRSSRAPPAPPASGLPALRRYSGLNPMLCSTAPTRS